MSYWRCVKQGSKATDINFGDITRKLPIGIELGLRLGGSSATGYVQ